MIIIKFFLISILTIIFLTFSFSSKMKIFQKLFVILGYLILFLFIANPKLADKIAQLFSIESGVNLIIYIVLAITSLINIILYVGQKNNIKAMTKIVREFAIDHAKKC